MLYVILKVALHWGRDEAQINPWSRLGVGCAVPCCRFQVDGMPAFGGGKSRFESDIGTRYAGRSQNKYQRLDAGISVGANPTPGSLYARVSEWFKEKTCKALIRKFKSCPVLQLVSYNGSIKTN